MILRSLRKKHAVWFSSTSVTAPHHLQGIAEGQKAFSFYLSRYNEHKCAILGEANVNAAAESFRQKVYSKVCICCHVDKSLCLLRGLEDVYFLAWMNRLHNFSKESWNLSVFKIFYVPESKNRALFFGLVFSKYFYHFTFQFFVSTIVFIV